jgi:hypothetical protein
VIAAVAKAIAISAGGVVIGTALTLSFAYGLVMTIVNDDPQEDEE